MANILLTRKCIFLNENIRIAIEISHKFVRKSTPGNKTTLFQAMAWYVAGTKPLPKPTMNREHFVYAPSQ